jgi:PAS domain S-box-containing protein
MSGVAEPLIQASLLGEAIDHGPVAVFVADDDLSYIAVNEFACSLLGYSRAELLDLKVTDVASDPVTQSDYADFVAHRAHNGHARLLHKDGTEISIAYRASETSVAGMRFYVAIGWPTDLA